MGLDGAWHHAEHRRVCAPLGARSAGRKGLLWLVSQAGAWRSWRPRGRLWEKVLPWYLFSVLWGPATWPVVAAACLPGSGTQAPRLHFTPCSPHFPGSCSEPATDPALGASSQGSWMGSLPSGPRGWGRGLRAGSQESESAGHCSWVGTEHYGPDFLDQGGGWGRRAGPGTPESSRVVRSRSLGPGPVEAVPACPAGHSGPGRWRLSASTRPSAARGRPRSAWFCSPGHFGPV